MGDFIADNIIIIFIIIFIIIITIFIIQMEHESVYSESTEANRNSFINTYTSHGTK
jgi:hypothetical protein